MEKDLKFSSAVCTSRVQSERLLALGLKKDTADMGSVRNLVHTTSNGTQEVIFTFTPDNWEVNPDSIPRWSLHRLIELAYGNWDEDIVPVYLGNSYDMLIGRIEFQVKQGKFNKEYLV